MNNNERIYIADDDEARARGEWREDDKRIYEVRAVLQPWREEPDNSLRIPAWCVVSFALLVGGALFLGVLRALGQ